MSSQRRVRITAISLAIASIISLNACTKSKPQVSGEQENAGLITNRPIAALPDLFVVTLNAPAILAASTKTDDGWNIPEEVKKAVLDEQTQFEQKMKSVAPAAQVLYRYRLVLNGLAVYADSASVPLIRALPGVKDVAPIHQMGRPESLNVTIASLSSPGKVTSVNFIGADEAYKLNIRGQGMRVGVLDTGIDYTHSMLGGSGDKAEFKAINPALPSPLFPNAKVAGGIDLVGTEFNAASPLPSVRLPIPDSNPIDEAGHGTHVAGTVAGIGDGVNSYDGVAPDAQVYAIKVFGKDGSTMDAVVIAGFEYAADPNGDLSPDDQLDVVNLSLGGGFGQPQILYTEAVRNLSRAGTVVVASAGNSGPVDYIVGAPGTADEALSVAASIDASPHNWQFAAVRFISPNNPNWMAKAVEGPISKPIAQIEPTEGELVDIGLGDVELTEEQKAKLKGNVALVKRGKVAFAEKVKRAFENGAVGAVVYNNDAGKPFAMGGDGKFDIPAIMVSQALGMKLLEEMAIGPVRIQFKTGEKIEEPDLIDSMTDFSSKGPRSEDNLLKPEISAPGSRVISAGMGEGTGAVQMDGTSMSAPHMAGVMALLKQARPTLSSLELKSLAMNTAKMLSGKQGPVPITLQGAGRVQVDKALQTPVISLPASLSLGRIAVEEARVESRKISLKNITAQDAEVELSAQNAPGLEMKVSASRLTVPANGTAEFTVEAAMTIVNKQEAVAELNGRILIKHNGQLVAQLPALAIRTQASQIQTQTTSVNGPIALTNNSPVDGMALAFNLLGEDTRKPAGMPSESWKSRACDLQSVGYRILSKVTAQGPKEFLQFAFKMHSPLTTWHFCEISVLIDNDEDGVPDQEFAGVSNMAIEGLKVPFASVLLDGAKMRALRLEFEQKIAAGDAEAKVDYLPAIEGMGGMAPFDQSSLAVIEAPLEAVRKTADGKFNVKAVAQATAGDALEPDDYLGANQGNYGKIESVATAQPFHGMTEFAKVVKISGGTVNVTRGTSSGKLILYYPMNVGDINGGNQHQILE